MEVPPPKVSQFLPPSIRNELVNTQGWNKTLRHLRIDTLTMQAHDQYPELVRHPSDTSRLGEWSMLAILR